jgi:hypothetical protein
VFVTTEYPLEIGVPVMGAVTAPFSQELSVGFMELFRVFIETIISVTVVELPLKIALA